MGFRKLLPLALAMELVASHSIDRQAVVSQFNPVRYESSNSTPMQVGNGNFAFGADVTGLQTFYPFGSLSSWGWHNFSLPNATAQNSPSDFTRLDRYNPTLHFSDTKDMLTKLGGLMDAWSTMTSQIQQSL
jgi:hypothetical protein